jgi:hypothetical protein
MLVDDRVVLGDEESRRRIAAEIVLDRIVTGAEDVRGLWLGGGAPETPGRRRARHHMRRNGLVEMTVSADEIAHLAGRRSVADRESVRLAIVVGVGAGVGEDRRGAFRLGAAGRAQHERGA